jgi:hypothetical protein
MNAKVPSTNVATTIQDQTKIVRIIKLIIPNDKVQMPNQIQSSNVKALLKFGLCHSFDIWVLKFGIAF